MKLMWQVYLLAAPNTRTARALVCWFIVRFIIIYDCKSFATTITSTSIYKMLQTLL